MKVLAVTESFVSVFGGGGGRPHNRNLSTTTSLGGLPPSPRSLRSKCLCPYPPPMDGGVSGERQPQRRGGPGIYAYPLPVKGEGSRGQGGGEYLSVASEVRGSEVRRSEVEQANEKS